MTAEAEMRHCVAMKFVDDDDDEERLQSLLAILVFRQYAQVTTMTSLSEPRHLSLDD